MSTPQPTPRRARREAGFSLVELMIAMGIGMVVMGAVFATYIAANQGTRHGRAIAQMAEDATSALAVLRANTAMAGFSVPTGFMSGQFFRRRMDLPFKAGTVDFAGGRYVAGCQGGLFNDTTAAIDALACAATDASKPDSLAVAYEANAGNSAMGGTPAAPLDCVGNATAQVAAAAGPPVVPAFNVSYSRFYLDGNKLMCRGNPANGAQPLAENVKDMQIQYGIQAQAVNGVKQPVVIYTTAENVPDWERVASLRICLVMQSAEANVVDAPTDYTGCFPANYSDKITPTDRRAYRAFTTTIALNNRLPVDPPVAPTPPTP